MRTSKLTTEGLDGRLPDENWRTLQQVRDSKLLTQAIEHRDPAEVERLGAILPKREIQLRVLPKLTIESRTWFWQNATSEEQFDGLVSSMHQAAFKMLSDADFAFGIHFSVAPLGDFPVLLVTREANEFLMDELPPERYATLQLILRFAEEEAER